ncbi:MAG: BamA/TamA family outer membrane protein [Bacteroidales bacterium]|nr:BamA/TamA family outer membrane protein [Bacteroidales bacterium]
MSRKSLIWKIPCIALCVVLGGVLLLLGAVTAVLVTPSARTAVLQRAVAEVNARTDWDVDLERLYLSPFHQSPRQLYSAFKGEGELPLHIEIDSLYLGHRGRDTLLYVHTLRLRGRLEKAASRAEGATEESLAVRTDGRPAGVNADKSTEDANLLSRTIVVDQLLLDGATFHSDTLIPAVGVNVILKHLQAASPGLIITKGQYPLHGLNLADAYVEIVLRDAPEDAQPGKQDETPPPLSFDIPDGELSQIHFVLNPLGLNICVDSLSTNVLVDVGGNRYDARRLDVQNLSLDLGTLHLPFDAINGSASVDLNTNLIQSSGLFVRSDVFGAKADLSASVLDLSTMRVNVTGNADFRGSKAQLRGYYDIDEEAYDVSLNVERVDISSFLAERHHVIVAGKILAQGSGIDPHSSAMKSRLAVRLDEGIYDQINVSGLTLDAELANNTVSGNLHLPFAMGCDSPSPSADTTLRLKAETEHRFRVSDFMTPERMVVDYHAQLNQVSAQFVGEDIVIDQLNLNFATEPATRVIAPARTLPEQALAQAPAPTPAFAPTHTVTTPSTSLNLTTQGLTINVQSPMHVLRLVDELQPMLGCVTDSTFVRSVTSLQDLTMLDTLRRLIPDLRADVRLTKGSPVQSIIERMGLDIQEVALSLASDENSSNLALDASIPDVGNKEDSTALLVPDAVAAMRVSMTEGKTTASFTAHSDITEGIMSVRDIRTNAALRFNLERSGSELDGAGQLALDSLIYDGMNLGNRTVDVQITPSEQYEKAVRADVRLNDIPLELVSGIVRMDDIGLDGFVRAKATIDGLPGHLDLSAEVLPLDVSATYKPYDVKMSLSKTPIVMNHNNVELNDFRIYSVDSSYLALNGGLDMDKMRLDIDVAADHFSPAKLEQGGPIPVYGQLATDIRGRVSGQLDSLLADVDVTILPGTDLTYPIDKKNLAQVKPHGTVNVQYDTADGALNLDGVIHVDEGQVRYSPKLYPMMPFQVDSASHIRFNGPLGKTMLNISASQQAKADVQSEGEEMRRVDFNTGVRINGELDSLNLGAIGFFLEAPNDETIERELASMDEDTREGTAAALLATGMYMGESNVAAQRGGYALSSIINSRLNAAMANSKMGKIIEVDISSGQTEHAVGKTNDTNIAISKSLFKDKLRITAGSTISDNPEVNKANGLLSRISADYKLTKSGNVLLRLFAQRDYDNIFEGELYKSGIGVEAARQWKRDCYLRSKGDTITRIYKLTADADVAYRSNSSIGPNLTLTHSIRNLIGNGETFAVKGYGAYYWALRDRYPGDPTKTDTYKVGVDASLTFPYLHWAGDNKPDGDTRYRIGYKYENIAGGCRVHKASGGFSYFIRPSRYLTHVFTPISLSVVRTDIDATGVNSADAFPELVRMLAGNEFVPSIGYGLTYSDYRFKRGVNTMFDFEVKESGNLINTTYSAFGRSWNEKEKKIIGLPFNQFVKLTVELCNKFNLTEQVSIATRIFAGANVPLGNSDSAPLSEAFYAGGPNSLRAAQPYAYGPGNFHSPKYNQSFFHAGDVKLEANLELRFPIFWKVFGAVFLDAGNVWNWQNTSDLLSPEDYALVVEKMGLTEDINDGIIGNPDLARQIALGTGAGLRLDLDGLVIRLDLGVGIHAPYQTYKYTKDFTPDLSQPITTYYNLPSVLDALRLNFGIGYPF